MFNADAALKKWAPLLDHTDCDPISDPYRRSVTAIMLEQQEKALVEARAHSSFQLNEASDTVAGDVDNFDPVLIALVRRAMPNLIAYDVAGVQPMNGPTGLIFAMKAKYTSDSSPANAEAFAGSISDDTAGAPRSGFSGPYTTADGEDLGEADSPVNLYNSMGFSIEKATVTAKTRALKAGYTMELAQDLKAIHGLDAEGELANILSAEILGEINREVIGRIDKEAVLHETMGSPSNTFDLDSSPDTMGARWGAEKFKMLAFEIEKACNKIALATRRGKGNYAIVSANVGSALAASGMLDYAPALSTSLNVDPTGNTFAGVLNGRIKVYIDPYAASNKVIVGYRGQNPYDAGLFYCPYVPLTMVKAVGEEDFQPRIAFKTRYGMRSNPYYADNTDNLNGYFRKFTVSGL